MNRNITKSNKLLFDNIILSYYCSGVNEETESFDEIRYISGSDEEKEWLVRLDLEIDGRISFWSDNICLFGTYQGHKYLITIGLDSIKDLPLGVEEELLNAGQFLAIVADLDLIVKKEYPPLKISNEILSQHVDSDGYVGHDFNELRPLFPLIKIFSINESTYPGDPSSLEQLVCLLLILNKDILKLPYSSGTLNSFQQLCYQNYSHIKYENLFQALTATIFKFAFLDVYRSIEMLYQVCYIVDIQKVIGNVDRSSLLKALDDSLSWRPNERNTLIKILNRIPVDERSFIVRQLPNVIERTTGSRIVKNDALWSWIYDLRCSIVHLKTYHSDFRISNKDWDIIIHGLLDVINSAYKMMSL